MKINDLLLENNILSHAKVTWMGDAGVEIEIPGTVIETDAGDIIVTEISISASVDPDNFENMIMAWASFDNDVDFDNDDYEDENDDDRDIAEHIDVMTDGLKEYFVRFGVPNEALKDFECGHLEDGGVVFYSAGLTSYLLDAIWADISSKGENAMAKIVSDNPDMVFFYKMPLTVIDLAKPNIIKKCLVNLKNSQFKTAMDLIDQLKSLGVNWPEFATIEKAITATVKQLRHND